MQLIDAFDRGAEASPSATCFVTRDASARWTYREIQDLSHRIASSLIASGIEPGDRVAVLSPNDPIAFACILGALRARATWVALNARSSVPDIVDLLDLVGCTHLFYNAGMEERADEIAQDVETLRGLVGIGGGRDCDPLLEEWMAPPGTTVARGPLEPEAIALMLGTGGTTGRAKAVELSHRAMQIMNLALTAHLPDPHPVQLMAAPMSHAAGVITFCVLMAGGVTVVHDHVDAAEIFDSIERHRVTRMFLPPTAIYSLLDHPDVRSRDFSSLRHFIYAAAPMSVEKLREAIDVFGPVMTQTYGQAEAPMICTFLSPEEHVEALADERLADRLASCGRPSVVADVGIMDDDGNLLAPGQVGEIVVRTNMRMSGYHRDLEQTTAADRGNGWHGTGDVGYKDTQRYVYIVDRKRDMIITGGFNVFPSEVEQVLWGHAAVRDCAVIGLPDDKWGEAVTAVVELRDGASVDEQELISMCKRRLGSVKAPKAVIFRDLPRSPVGKVLKRELRDQYWAGRARAV